MTDESSLGSNEQWVGAGNGPVHKAPLPIVLSEDPTFCLDASPSSESTYAARPAVFNACNEKRKSQLVGSKLNLALRLSPFPLFLLFRSASCLNNLSRV